MLDRHPWDDWFQSLAWPDDHLTLVWGQHFECTPDSLMKQFRRQAQERGLELVMHFSNPSPGKHALVVSRIFRSAALPWDLWLNGEPHVLVQGVDFSRARHPISVAQAVHTAARRRGQKATVNTRDGMVRIQALTPPAASENKAQVADALRAIEPGRRYTLAELEAMTAHLPFAPRARKLSDLLRRLGWRYVRTASARYWEAPSTNMLEPDAVGST